MRWVSVETSKCGTPIFPWQAVLGHKTISAEPLVFKLKQHSDRDSIAWWELGGDRLPAVSPIGAEVAPVHGPYLAPLVQLRHAHHAGISQVHRLIGVLGN